MKHMEGTMRRLRIAAAAAGLAASGFALSAASASAETRVLVAYLAGANEVPTPADPDAFGVATVTLNTATSLCYTIFLQNGLAATAAHIHSGLPGAAGAPIVPLPVTAALPTTAAGCVAVAAATITAIRNNPGSFYVNVHDAAFPGGSARGQLK